MSAPTRANDAEWGRFISWLRAHGLEAHTDRRGHTTFQKRRPSWKRFGTGAKPSLPLYEVKGGER